LVLSTGFTLRTWLEFLEKLLVIILSNKRADIQIRQQYHQLNKKG